MRVLWFTNVPFPDAGPEFGGSETGSGGWMWGLAAALREHTEVTIGVATACQDGENLQIEKNGIWHYRIAVSSKHFDRVTQLSIDDDFIHRCQEVVSLFKPDLIHIHGTEQTYGLLTAGGHLKLPVVVSLQGILSGIVPHYFGTMGIRELLKCHGLVNLVFQRGIIFDWMKCKKRCAVESRIINGNQHFIGRTLWDRAHLRRINPKAKYHHCGEVLRPVFYGVRKQGINNDTPTILATWGASPIRGTEIVLKALALVRRTVPTVQLRLVRGQFKRSRWLRGYWTYLDRLIKRLDLSDNVKLLTSLNAEGYAKELEQSNVFVLASLIENSSNSLCEAMVLGTPSVVSYVGGISSLITSEQTGLCFPPGEHAVMAEQLIRLLGDDALAHRISINAREVGRMRHDPKTIAHRTIEIYEEILELSIK